jgi:GNAT superfamily N-acetyltransferase
MAAGDIPAGLALCRAAGWNQVAEDWALLLQHSHGAARVVLHEGAVVGTVTAVGYQHRFGWVGMVLVDERHRRRGLGTRLLSLALEGLSACGTVKLDATPAGRPVYLPLGFVDEWGLMRMETVATPVTAPGNVSVRAMRPDDLPTILAWDREVFGAARGEILARYRELAPEYARIAERGTHLAGYVFGRRGFRWDQLGPVIATDRDAAQALLATLLTHHAGRRFIVDTSLSDPHWVAWLRAIGFCDQRAYTRMFRGANRYPGRPNLQYAILGPELG